MSNCEYTKCIHYPVCENKNYNISFPCDYYEEEKIGALLDYLNGKYECSECRKELVEEVRFYPRCPWCGAFLTIQTPVVDKEAENE